MTPSPSFHSLPASTPIRSPSIAYASRQFLPSRQRLWSAVVQQTRAKCRLQINGLQWTWCLQNPTLFYLLYEPQSPETASDQVPRLYHKQQSQNCMARKKYSATATNRQRCHLLQRVRCGCHHWRSTSATRSLADSCGSWIENSCLSVQRR